MSKDQGHNHKCSYCGKEYKHYSQNDEKCKKPLESICGVCQKDLEKHAE